MPFANPIATSEQKNPDLESNNEVGMSDVVLLTLYILSIIAVGVDATILITFSLTRLGLLICMAALTVPSCKKAAALRQPRLNAFDHCSSPLMLDRPAIGVAIVRCDK